MRHALERQERGGCAVGYRRRHNIIPRPGKALQEADWDSSKQRGVVDYSQRFHRLASQGSGAVDKIAEGLVMGGIARHRGY